MRRRTACFTLCLLLLVISACSLRRAPDGTPQPPEAGGQGANLTPPNQEPGAPTNLLLLGIDARPGEPGRSDTILVAQMADDQLRLLSIPRDTLVTIEGYGEVKVNSAYTYGGPQLASKVVSDLLGLPIHHYATVNMAGFRQLVDLIGGVPYDVPIAMRYRDPTDGTVIDLKPGMQVLDGRKAEQFVRFRSDAAGDDLSRIRRQQGFLRAAADQALQPANLARLPTLLYTASRYVNTDLTLPQQVRLGQQAFRAKQQGAITMAMLPGRPDWLEGISFYVPNRQEMDSLLAAWRSRQAPPTPQP